MKYVAKVNLKFKGNLIKAGQEHPEPNQGLIDSGFIEAVEDAAPPQNPEAPSGDAEPSGEPNAEPAAHDADAEPAPEAEAVEEHKEKPAHKHHKKHKR